MADLARTGEAERTDIVEQRHQEQLAGKPSQMERPSPLFASEETSQLRRRWAECQAGFVDDPRATVKAADSLVAETMKRLAEIFANERSGLESQWDRGDEVSTEDLRQAMRRYRSFFDRLLSV